MTTAQARTQAKPAPALPTVGMGAIAGMRSMAAPALVSDYFSRTRPEQRGTPVQFLNSPRVATVLKLLAVGELVADKTPQIPARTDWPSLLGRCLSGTVAGAALYAGSGRHAIPGALLGGTVAALSTFGSYHLRQYVNRRFNLPDPLVGVIEDAIVIGGGIGLLRRLPR
jgi:uncharacterized membrane protein